MPDNNQAVKNTLQPLCTEKNIVRETYYGTTHRATFTLGGVNKQWDILHISIPFTPLKEAELMRRFGIERDQLPAFYHEFSKSILNHVTLAKAVVENAEADTLKKSIVSYQAIQTFRKTGNDGKSIGSDLYFITEPMESFIGTETFQENAASIKTINNLGLRLLQTAKSLNDRGFTMGAVDLDSYFLVQQPSGKKL